MPIVQGAAGLDSTAYIIQVNPTVQGFQAPVGAMAYSFATSTLYVKVGDGAREWSRVSVGSGDAAPVQAFELDVGEIDFTAIGNYTITVPPGYYFIVFRCSTLQTQLNGTLTSAAISNIGNDAAKVNVAASSASTFGALGSINTAPTGLKQYNVALNTLNPAVSNLVSTDTPFTLQITTGAVLNTATVYRGRVSMMGSLIPVVL